jgi:protein TonB
MLIDAMFKREWQGHRAISAIAIIAAHVIALWAAASATLQLRVTVPNLPLDARFIDQPSIERRREPPMIGITAALPSVHAPVLPAVEIPIAPSVSDRAITVPEQAAVVSSDSGLAKWVSAVEYVREPAPRYPVQSRRLREEGLVVLRVLIDERGTACKIDIERSSGHARLDHAAREAVARAVFRPYVEDGTAKPAQVLIPIEFAIKRSSA